MSAESEARKYNLGPKGKDHLVWLSRTNPNLNPEELRQLDYTQRLEQIEQAYSDGHITEVERADFVRQLEIEYPQKPPIDPDSIVPLE